MDAQVRGGTYAHPLAAARRLQAIDKQAAAWLIMAMGIAISPRGVS